MNMFRVKSLSAVSGGFVCLQVMESSVRGRQGTKFMSSLTFCGLEEGA